ncbi:MAG TPA: Rap1a/Tai family immunity protein [Xanthobacteraceae bacterium]
MKAILIVMLICCGVVQARAQDVIPFIRGNDLLAQCLSGANPAPIEKLSTKNAIQAGFGNGMCLGYILAIADVLSSERKVCFDGGIDSRHVRAVVLKTLRPNAASAARQVGSVLAKAFPCK